MNFNAIMHVDVFDLVASLKVRLPFFDNIKLRQELQPQHKDTRTIYLCGPVGIEYDPELWFKDVQHKGYIALAGWNEAYEVLSFGTKFKTPMAKSMIVELAPGGIVQWHKDEGEYADAHDRYHLPLVTNPGCMMYSGSAAAHIPVGMLTYFNNHVPHSAVNFGTTPRYHLIVDFRKSNAA